MLDFVELLADETGLPVGIKSAVGDMTFWQELADAMERDDRGVDFITIDGGEGGTGASPLIFTDAVSLPFRLGFARVYAEFARRGLHEDVTFIGAGKLGLPDNAVVAFALGADMVNVAREAMLAVGCVQAQKCHTGECPTGVATQNPWLAHGLDPIARPSASPTTSRRCAATCSRSPRPAASSIPPYRPGVRRGPRQPQRRAAARRGLRLRARLGLSLGQDREEIARIMAVTDEEKPRPRVHPRRRRLARAPTRLPLTRMPTRMPNSLQAASAENAS